MLWRMSGMETVVSIALGIGLAAAVGFRVFVPLLVASVAAYSGHLHLDENFAWLGTLTAITMLAVAAVVEVLAYYVPVVDNLLDTITTPLALVAGTEGEGLSDAILSRFRTARIPQQPGLDSLNVATASGIALYQMALLAGRIR